MILFPSFVTMPASVKQFSKVEFYQIFTDITNTIPCLVLKCYTTVFATEI